MRCALAALGFVNGDTERNVQTVLATMRAYAGQADVVLFGESFLQGFYAADFDPAHDRDVALTLDSPAVRRIREAARALGVAVSFGFIERDGGDFYSSQLTIDAEGAIADHYRRVSPGWKLPHAGPEYREGGGFRAFPLCGKRVAVGLCGDLWYDENIEAVNRLEPEVVLWPVYTDYSPGEWNGAVKAEYAQQAGRIGADVLYVNSVCLDREGEEIARGGAAHFRGGRIMSERPSGAEGVLVVEVP